MSDRQQGSREWPTRRRWPTWLSWPLLWSLLINHALVVPGAYWLLVEARGDKTDSTVTVELVPDKPSPTPEKKPAEPKRLAQRVKQRARPRPPRPEPRLELPKSPEPPKPKPKVELPKPPTVTPLPRMKMVETNTPETKEPPKHARYLSDKNRRVERETRARFTNLVRDQQQPRPPPAPQHQKRRLTAGAEQPKVARPLPQPRSDRHRERQRLARRTVAMRPQTARKERQERRLEQRPWRLPRDDEGERPLPPPAQKAQPAQRAQKARQRIDLRIDHRDYDRIEGERARKARRRARLSMSQPKGRRHQRKWKRIRSALENFVPEVRPGNQTALGTRAHPFAIYIARMHRRIHNYWGFGFLVDLDGKADSNPMNDMRLWSMVELVVSPRGDVEKATIVKSSGVLTFDVAALDTVFSTAPYGTPPRAIRSADGKVYLHWRFHRDHRQCGTFGVDPYILTKPPKGPIDVNPQEVGRPSRVARLNRPHSRRSTSLPPRHHRRRTARRPRVPRAPTARARAAAPRLARAAARARVSSRDPAARAVARRFLNSFKAADAAKMAAACRLPFFAHGRKVATKRSVLHRMLGDLLSENRQRSVSNLELLTAIEARKRFGRLPRGIRWGEPKLIARTRLGSTPVTLILERQSGAWKVVGLNR